jgi:uncharacterized protein YukE
MPRQKARRRHEPPDLTDHADTRRPRRSTPRLRTAGHVEARAQEIESRLRAIETGVGPQMWRGEAADGFAALLAETGPDLTRLVASYGAASQALATYATELAAAQDTARAAAAEATTAAESRDRATADRDSARSEAARHAAGADEANIRLDPVGAQDAERRRTDAVVRENAAGAGIDQAEQALQAARQKADQAISQRDAAAARCIRELDAASGAGIDPRNLTQDSATSNGPSSAASFGAVAEKIASDTVKNVGDDLQGKAALHAVDLTIGGGAAGIAEHRVVSLKRESNRLMDERAVANQRYSAAPGGSAEARFYSEQAQRKFYEADALRREADKIGRRVGAKVGVASLGISVAGIGHDIAHDKPLVKAVASGISGAFAAAKLELWSERWSGVQFLEQ